MLHIPFHSLAPTPSPKKKIFFLPSRNNNKASTATDGKDRALEMFLPLGTHATKTTKKKSNHAPFFLQFSTLCVRKWSSTSLSTLNNNLLYSFDPKVLYTAKLYALIIPFPSPKISRKGEIAKILQTLKFVFETLCFCFLYQICSKKVPFSHTFTDTHNKCIKWKRKQRIIRIIWILLVIWFAIFIILKVRIQSVSLFIFADTGY